MTRVIYFALILLLMLLGQCAEKVIGYTTMSDIDRLITEKKEGYNKLLRPKYNQSEPLYVSMKFDLIAIRDFDEVAEKFSVVGTMYSIWQDDRMSWEPKEYGGLKSFIVENGDFWTPPFILVNAFEKFEKVGMDSYWPIRFYDPGYVLFYPGQVFTTTCSVNVELYPWDTQTCSLFFTIWGHVRDEIILVPLDGQDKVSLTYYNGNGEWDLVDTNAASVDYTTFEFKFTMARKPLFILVNTLVPIILMSVLNIIAFLIPIASGERISYCITVLLALAVFLTLIGETMPRSATTIAVLCYYLICVLALSMLIILASVISMRIYHKGELEEASPCWSAFVRFVRCRWVRNKRLRYEKKTNTDPLAATTHNSEYLLYRGRNKFNSRTGLTQNRVNVISEMTNAYHSQNATVLSGTFTDYPETNWQLSEKKTKHLELNRQNIHQCDFEDDSEGEEPEQQDTITWKDVSSTIDIVFFVLAAIVLAIFTGIYFVYTLHSSSKQGVQ